MGLSRRAFLELGRVSNLPTCVSNATAGFYLGGGSIALHPKLWLMSVIATICFYEAGMVFNDVCDYEIDLVERPDRPIPSGQVTRAQALLIVFLLFALGWLAVFAFFRHAWPVALGLSALIVVYDLFHAKLAASPLLMGLCRGSVYLLSASAAAWRFQPGWIAVFALALTSYIVAVSLVAKDETSNRISPRQRLAALTTLAIPSLLLVGATQSMTFAACALGIALGWLAPVVGGFLKKRIAPPEAVGKMLAGICLFDGVVLARIPAYSGAILAWACFMGTVFSHRRIRGS